jgi:hypothetical protein
MGAAASGRAEELGGGIGFAWSLSLTSALRGAARCRRGGLRRGVQPEPVLWWCGLLRFSSPRLPWQFCLLCSFDDGLELIFGNISASNETISVILVFILAKVPKFSLKIHLNIKNWKGI